MHLLVEVPGAAQALDDPARDEPADEQQQHADREEEDEEPPGEGVLHEEGHRRDEGRGEEGGVDDELELLGARAEDVALVGAEDREHDDPRRDEEAARQDRVLQDVAGGGEDRQREPEADGHRGRGRDHHEVDDADEPREEADAFGSHVTAPCLHAVRSSGSGR